MKAILTKVLPATNAHPTRIRAYDCDGNKVTVSYEMASLGADSALEIDRPVSTDQAAHTFVTWEFVTRMKWLGDDKDWTLDKAIGKGGPTECVWSEDGEDGPWATGCGHYFAITDGTPSDNDMRYCCFCGRALRELPHEDDRHDAALAAQPPPEPK